MNEQILAILNFEIVWKKKLRNYTNFCAMQSPDTMMDAQRRREECERKARRGEMDPRLEFTFQLLMDGTGLPRHQIMDHIFEGNMLDEL